MRGGARGERLYRWLLRAYPADFRQACEDDLIADFRRDTAQPRYRGIAGRMRFWRHTLADWARTAWSERRGADPTGPPPRSGVTPTRVGGADLTLRHAARALWRDPAYSVVAIVTLAVGISATTVVFTLVNGLLLTPLPLPEPHRLVQVEERERGNPGARMMAYGNWLDLAARSEAFTELGLYAYDTKTLTGVDAALRLRSREVSANFFDAIGVAPALGRGFNPEELVEGQHQVVALSHALWRDAFGGDEQILGRTIQLDATPFTVVGVLPAGFDFPSHADIWVPLVAPAADRMRRAHRFRATGRLADGVDLQEAQQVLEVIGTRLEQDHPDTNRDNYFVAFPLLDDYVGDARPALRMLSGAVGLVLLIACVNIAGLSLARSSARRQEVAMRRALGAGRRHLAGLVLSEGLLLGAVGGAVGLALALAGLRALVTLAGDQIPRAENVTLNAPVFAFAATVSVLAALLVSLLPLWRESATGAGALLGGRGVAGPKGALGRRALVVGEVALAVVLVAGAGLLGRSLVRLTSVEVGIDPDGVLSMNIALPNGKYPTSADSARFFARLMPEIEALPGVERAAVTLTEPANPYGWYNSLRIRGRALPENEVPAISYVVVSPGYFETLELPVVAGRGFTDADETGGAMVAVVNRAAARLHWPDSSPLGAMILGRENDDSSWAEVIGVVDDMRQSLYEPAQPEVYVPVSQDRVLSYVLVARGSGDAMQSAAAVRELINETDPDVPVTGVMSLTDRIGQHAADARLSAGLMTSFAAIALVLASVGVYGVLSYSVSLRRREFGLRTAVGATRGRVVGMVLREALLIGAVAVAAGTVGALMLGRLLSGMLFEVSSRDPLTLTLVGGTVAAVTLLAALAPAWRAASCDPLVVLRND